MGQPPRGYLSWGLLAGYAGESQHATGRVWASVTGKEIVPVLRWLDLTGEASAGVTGSEFDPRLGLYLGLPLFMAGVNYDLEDNHFPFVMSARFPLKRGGLLGAGDLFRIDYRPGDQEIQIGLSFHSPFQTYRMTRPRSTKVQTPSGEVSRSPADLDSLPPGLESRLGDIEHAIAWMDRLLTPKFENEESTLAIPKDLVEHMRMAGHDFWGEDSTYHYALDAAFIQAVSGDSTLGLRLAAQAESVIFEDILVPFDQRFCQIKSPNHAGGYCRQAQDAFTELLAANPRFQGKDAPPAERKIAEDIFGRVVLAIDRASRASRDRWQRTVLVWHTRNALAWLPLNYGLRRAQYDTQAEWDGILARMTRPFLDANSVEYLMFDQFHPRLKQMIRNTKKYQVTIVHDFRGSMPDGHTDLYGWDVVVDGYLRAFTNAVDSLDTRGALPQFFLFLDENYYRANRSRGIISYLENLYDGSDPDVDDAGVREQIDHAHAALTFKIKHSKQLSDLTPERLRELFKVHVNITNPFDPAYFKDVTRRDHRKVAFCDVFEDDPGSGSAIFTGQGIGDHYNGNAWDDRSLLVRGPALVQLKTATRDLFLSQGFKPTEVPEYLQLHLYPADYQAQCDSLRRCTPPWNTPLNITMNQTGYGNKQVSVLKATIYNLAPPRGIIMSFDSLWISEFWGSMLVSAALRGAHVFVVAPTPRSAPSNAAATLFFLRRNLQFLFNANRVLADQIRGHDGALHIGMYSQDVPVNDLAKRTELFVRGRLANPFLQKEFPFDPSVAPILGSKIHEYGKIPPLALQLRPHPFLHLKTQIFGTHEAFQVTRLKQWGPVLKKYMKLRDDQMRGLSSSSITPQLLQEEGLTCRALEDTLRRENPGSEDRVIFTFSIGSHNQDPRSQFLDAETAVTISGWDCLISAIDCQLLLAISNWPKTQEEFNSLFPEIRLGLFSPFYKLLEDQS